MALPWCRGLKCNIKQLLDVHSCHHHDYRAKLNKKLVFAKYPAMFLIIRSDLTKIFPKIARKMTQTEKELNNNPCLIRNQAGANFHHERICKEEFQIPKCF